VFAETREEIRALYREDAGLFERGGTAAAGQTGEEYRQLLRKATENDPEKLANMPWKIGSGMADGYEQGAFFCAAVGERTYLRFLRTDASWRALEGDDAMLSELGTCLRLIECNPETLRALDPGTEEAMFALWDRARDDIFQKWTAETDPATLQPRVPAINRAVADFVRKNPPADQDQAALARALDVLEQKWPAREERELRTRFNDADDSGATKAARLVSYALDTGIEPFRAPDPLPPIEREEIHLVCWMAVKAKVPQ
jgi:hypothetical protein